MAKNERHYFRIAGVGYVLIFVLAIFANFFVFEVFYNPADMVQTAADIAANDALWRIGALAFLIIAVIDVFIAWALYYVFKNRSESLSALSALMRAVHGLLLAAASVFFYLATVSAYMADIFHLLWMVGLLFFGIHLVLTALLLWKQSKVQSIIAGLLILAGLAYIVDTSLLFVLANYELIAGSMLTIVATVGIIGELWFTLWILYKGFWKS